MEYGEAKAIGDAGEQQVAAVLARYREQNQPAGYLPNVLLEVGRMTAQLDHVLVDRHGILMIEVKVRNAFLRGTADQPKWTAVYGGSNKTFQNPLEQLTRQRNTLREALRCASDPIDADLVQSVVVFVGADIHALDLDSASRRRVTTIEGLPSLLRDRAAVAEGLALTDERVRRRYEQLRLMNRSADPAVVARHAAYRGGGSVPAAVQLPAATLPDPVPSPKPFPNITWSGNPYRPMPTPVPNMPALVRPSISAVRPPAVPRKTKRQAKREAARAELVVTVVLMVILWLWISAGGLASFITRTWPAPTTQTTPVMK